MQHATAIVFTIVCLTAGLLQASNPVAFGEQRGAMPASSVAWATAEFELWQWNERVRTGMQGKLPPVRIESGEVEDQRRCQVLQGMLDNSPPGTNTWRAIVEVVETWDFADRAHALESHAPPTKPKHFPPVPKFPGTSGGSGQSRNKSSMLYMLWVLMCLSP